MDSSQNGSYFSSHGNSHLAFSPQLFSSLGGSKTSQEDLIRRIKAPSQSRILLRFSWAPRLDCSLRLQRHLGRRSLQDCHTFRSWQIQIWWKSALGPLLPWLLATLVVAVCCLVCQMRYLKAIESGEWRADLSHRDAWIIGRCRLFGRKTYKPYSCSQLYTDYSSWPRHSMYVIFAYIDPTSTTPI